MPHYLEEEFYKHSKQSDDILHFIQSDMLDGLWYWDLEHPENEWMNQRFWKILGYDPNEKEALASEWQDIIHPEDLELALHNFKTHCKNPSHPYDQIVRYTHKQGHTIWVRCRGLAIRDESGKPIRMLGGHVDITKQKKVEQELIHKNKLLERLYKQSYKYNNTINKQNEELYTLTTRIQSTLHMISHDLRGPISSTLSLLEMFSESKEELPEAIISTMIENLRLAYVLLENILTIDTIKSGKIEFRMFPVQLSQIVQQAESILRNTFERKLIQLEINIEPNAYIVCDEVRILQVLQNLLKNAIKFSPQKSKICVYSTSTENEITLYVTDYGVGIEPEKIPRLFIESERTSTRGTDGEEGTGFGIPISDQILVAHKSKLHIESLVGKGTTCSFTFPLLAPENVPPEFRTDQDV